MHNFSKTLSLALISIFLGVSFSNLLSQLPNTNIYTINMQTNEQKVLLKNVTLLTNFNIDGYNNQPHFINNNELLITSNYKSSGLTDILQLNVESQKITRITSTEESEYSPTIMANGYDFSIIRQELDDSQPVPQVLWSYPLDRSNSGTQIVPKLENIGYHVWVTPDKVALYLVTEPAELILYDTKNKTTTQIAKNIGRCLKVDQNNRLYYLQNKDGVRTIRRYDIYLGRSRHIASAIEGQNDFDLLPNGHLIAAKGSQLMTFIPHHSSSWSNNIDLAPAGIRKISRIASSRNKLAIVVSGD